MNKITILIVAFLVIGGYLIVMYNDYDLKSDKEDRKEFLKDFSGWIVNLGKSVKDVGEVASDKEWLPPEEGYEEYSDNDTVK